MPHSHQLTALTRREIERIRKEYGKDKNTPCALAVLAERISTLPEIRRLVCHFDNPDIHPLGAKPYYTLHAAKPAIYLLGWREGEWTEVHDHGKCEVGIHVLQGIVEERLYVTKQIIEPRHDRLHGDPMDGDVLASFSRPLPQGITITCPEQYMHSMGNIRPETAATLHVYGPDLHDMRLYKAEGRKLKFVSFWQNGNEPH